MIACDTSSLSAFLKNEDGEDVLKLTTAIVAGDLWLPPVVLVEITSDPKAGPSLAASLAGIELLPITDGFWQRAGDTRRTILTLGLKARVADALIAQVCIDNKIPLITRGTDFRHFAKHCGLMLA